MPTTWLNVLLLAQSDRADCLPACVEMVLTFLGQKVERQWLRRALNG